MSKGPATDGKSLRKRPTIYDLARQTGFSRGSISRAFNNSPNINASTREKILKAARELGYAPHSGARLIKATRTRRWGILLPDFSNPYYAQIFEAFDIEARRQQTFLQLGLFHYDVKISEGLALDWSGGEVDGLIVDAGAAASEAKETFLRLQRRGVPLIMLHAQLHPEFDTLVFDRTVGLEHTLQSLQSLGHRRVAHVGMITRHERESTSYVNWRAWMEQHGEGDPEELSCFVPNNSMGGEQGWKILTRRGARFTAVVAYNDIIACGLIHAARLDGRRVPEDLSVVGEGDSQEGHRLGLTTMRTDLQLGAVLCFRQMEARRQGDRSPAVVHRVESEFVLRHSFGPASA
jgi:LacI family transcriptional regulator